MKIPENNAVIDTAMFIRFVSIPRSRAITGEMFRVVCANSQNASTPKMMPNRTRSFPTNGASRPGAADRAGMGISFTVLLIWLPQRDGETTGRVRNRNGWSRARASRASRP